ncbi:hypothetical protein [Sinomonas susongensis]|uniref:hypothetical protein n=1 Tax=Sinomonas susongensis TaxID=1324851 RepID=UPI001107DB7E|nr:hypothetical protein [Sinomonas susongensis]
MRERRRLGPLGGSTDHGRDAVHVQSCAECRGALESERRYLAALRDAPVPMASSALTQRLLEQTRELALEAELAEHVASSKGRVLRAAAVVLTVAAAALAALAVTAYAVAGDPTAASPTASWPAVVGMDDGGRVLTSSDLRALSADGWNCPELEQNGLHVESAKGFILNGVPTLVVRMGDGAHAISLMEQHGAKDSTGAPQTTVLASDFPSTETASLVREMVSPLRTQPPAESPTDRLARGLHLVLSAAGRP